MDNPSGWVFRVALNDVRRRARRSQRGDELVRAMPALSDGVPSTEQAAAVWDAVSRLPERMRTAIALRYLGSLTERECAQAMRISEGAVSSQLVAARNRLRTELSDAFQGAER